MFSISEVKRRLEEKDYLIPDSVKTNVQDYYAMSLHIDGILPRFTNAFGNSIVPDKRNNTQYQFIFDNFLLARHPRENDLVRQWRYSQYFPNQRDPFLKIIGVVNAAIFQDTNYSLTVDNKSDEDYFWPNNGSANFFSKFSALTPNIFTDANGYFSVVPNVSYQDKGSNKVEPELIFILSKDILIKTNDEIVFEREGIYWLINKVGYFRFYKDSEDNFHLMDEKGYYAHLLGIVPIIVAGGIRNTSSYSSWLISGKAFADEYVGSKSAELLVNKEASHPFITAAATECGDCRGYGTFTFCSQCDKPISECVCEVESGGFIQPKLRVCSSCGGSGEQSRNPGDWLRVPKDEMSTDLIKIVTPDVQVNKHLKETSLSVFNQLMEALHLSVSESKHQSGVAKTKDLEPRYEFILAISNDWFDRVIPELIAIILRLRNAKVVGGKLQPFAPPFTIIKPTQFSIKTASDLLIEYQISTQSGMPQYIRAKQLEDYVDKHFGGDHVMAKTVRVINELDMLSTALPTELSALVGTAEWQYHMKLPLAIKRVIREKSPEWFLKADMEDIEKAANILIEITAPVPVNNDGNAKYLEQNGIMPIFGEGNMATRSGNSPTGTGFYDQTNF